MTKPHFNCCRWSKSAIELGCLNVIQTNLPQQSVQTDDYTDTIQNITGKHLKSLITVIEMVDIVGYKNWRRCGVTKIIAIISHPSMGRGFLQHTLQPDIL